MEKAIHSRAQVEQLKNDTSLSVRELQHEIDVAQRVIAEKIAVRERYQRGWRSKLHKITKSSVLDVLRQEIVNYEAATKSMKRIQRLVKDNEAARLPGLTEQFDEDLCAAEDYESYLRVRDLLPSAPTAAELR